MPRMRIEKLSGKQKKSYPRALFRMIKKLDSEEKAEKIFDGLLSETELLMIANRILIAKMLMDGKSFRKIAKELKTSEGTIAKIHLWVRKFSEEQKTKKKKGKRISHEQYQEDWIYRKYPLHMFFVKIIRDAWREMYNSDER